MKIKYKEHVLIIIDIYLTLDHFSPTNQLCEA